MKVFRFFAALLSGLVIFFAYKKILHAGGYGTSFVPFFMAIPVFGLALNRKTTPISLLLSSLYAGYAIVFFLVNDSMGFNLEIILPEMLAIIADTNSSEVSTFLTNTTWRIFLPLLSSLLVIACLFIKESCIGRQWMYMVIPISVIMSGIVATNKSFSINMSYSAVKDNLNMIEQSKEAAILKSTFHWGAVSNISSKSTVLIVLGETTRGDHLNINGYPRDTTPLLAKEKVISFTDVVSNGAYTLVSTPYIMTRKPVEKSGISTLFGEKSVISAYKEAGYKTYYVSYLSQAHVGDNAINQIVNEADIYIQRPVGEGDAEGIPIISDILRNDSSEKKLIVFKLIGSHYNYQDRYPANFDVFKPSFKTQPYTTPTVEDAPVLVNTYDNTIRYTDYVVSELINLLKSESGDSLMSFISDHGTSIYDDGKTIYVGNTKSNYNIPLFFWFNENAKARLGEKLGVLISNIGNPVDSKYFIDTMLDISGIRTLKDTGKSLADKNVDIGVRYVVVGRDVVDYDSL